MSSKILCCLISINNSFIEKVLDVSFCDSPLFCLEILQLSNQSINSTALKKLAYTKDNQGRTLLHIMHKEVADYFKHSMYFLGRYEVQDKFPIHCSATSIVFAALDHGIESDYEHVFSQFTSDDNDQTKYLGNTTFQLAVKRYLFENEAFGYSISHEEMEKAFTDNSNCGKIFLEEWLAFCRGKFGSGSRSVVIKFIRDKDKFDREIMLREDNSTTENTSHNLLGPFVLGILNHFTPETPGASEEERRGTIGDLTLPDGSSLVDGYLCGIVLPAADRNLDNIYGSERPGLPRIKVMMQEIGEALQHCHTMNIIHGDLKMFNVVRINGKMRLIDLDAAAVINEDDFGAKFSSGVLPPEMFCKLENGTEAVEDYARVFVLFSMYQFISFLIIYYQ